MYIKHIIIFIFLLYIFIFPAKAKAEKISVFYFNNDDVYSFMNSRNFEIKNLYNSAEKIFITLDKLFNNIQNINYIPKDTKVLNVEKIGKTVYVNLSGETLSYGGGSNYETGLVRQLLCNIFQFEEIDAVTIFIDNKITYFPEGTLIYDFKRTEFTNLPQNMVYK